MKKVVSMFMALIMAFTMGPMVARAEDECVGDECRLESDVPNTMNSTNSTGWAWCKENPKDCVAYAGETALNGTKLVAVKAWDVTKPVCDKVWAETAWVRGKMADGAVATWATLKNYNYTQLGENMKWCAHNPGDCAASVYDEAKEWIGDRGGELAAFKGDLEAFCDDGLKNQAKWPFVAMVGLAAYKGADAALNLAKLTGKVAWGTVKLCGKVIVLSARFAMKLCCPCFRSSSSN